MTDQSSSADTRCVRGRRRVQEREIAHPIEQVKGSATKLLLAPSSLKQKEIRTGPTMPASEWLEISPNGSGRTLSVWPHRTSGRQCISRTASLRKSCSTRRRPPSRAIETLLLKHLKESRRAPVDRDLRTEPSDHPTHREIVALGRRHFLRTALPRSA